MIAVIRLPLLAGDNIPSMANTTTRYNTMKINPMPPVAPNTL